MAIAYPKFGIRNLKVGFTGTQNGMTGLQRKSFSIFLQSLSPSEFHHGDCIGSDKEAHDEACLCHFDVIIHPPIKSVKRVYCQHEGHGSFKVLPEKNYMDRNQDIVDAVDLLIATPNNFYGELRSGTWATIRKALKAHKIVFVIWPDGNCKHVEY